MTHEICWLVKLSNHVLNEYSNCKNIPRHVIEEVDPFAMMTMEIIVPPSKIGGYLVDQHSTSKIA